MSAAPTRRRDPGIAMAGRIEHDDATVDLDAITAADPALAAADHGRAHGHKGRTLLHMAAMKGMTRTAAACLMHGADPDARENHGCTAWDLVASHGHDRTLAAMWAVTAPVHGPPLAAAIHGPLASTERIIAVCLAHGADVNRHDGHGMVGLVQAARSHASVLITRLIGLGADPSVRETTGGGSALIGAAHAGGSLSMTRLMAGPRSWTGAWDPSRGQEERHLEDGLWESAMHHGCMRSAWLHAARFPDAHQPTLSPPTTADDHAWLMGLIAAAPSPPMRILAMLGTEP